MSFPNNLSIQEFIVEFEKVEMKEDGKFFIPISPTVLDDMEHGPEYRQRIADLEAEIEQLRAERDELKDMARRAFAALDRIDTRLAVRILDDMDQAALSGKGEHK